MKFYFTYGSSGMAYEGGWTEECRAGCLQRR